MTILKICFAVCEYNPLHNGHLQHLNYIKEELSPDLLVLIMSGNFTQRGEIAVLDKYTRATHAILAGADAVLELPTVFATGNAEIFAKGAIKLLSSFKGEHEICFGTESATENSLLKTSATLLKETAEFKNLYKEELKSGITSIRAKVNALRRMNIQDVDCELLQSPNNILGIEYTKAILTQKCNLKIRPIIRQGAGYNDEELKGNVSSATAIRKAVLHGRINETKSSLPDFVYKDLNATLPNCDELIFYSLLKSTKAELKGIMDCTEGLENRIKGLLKNTHSLEELKDKLKTKRYTYTRISRILLSSMLGIKESFIRKCLKNDLYLKVLALNGKKDNLLSTLSKMTNVPLITRKSDADKLEGVAKECFEKDVFANDIYNFICKIKTNEYEMKIVK